MIIAVEGIDGAGKNTLVTALSSFVKATVIAFPRYRISAAADLADLALHRGMGDLVDSVEGMAALFALDRHAAKEHLDCFSARGDKADEFILLDRYVASNAAYSWARSGKKEIVKWVYDLEFGRLALPIPDIQILLATPTQLAAQRARDRESTNPHRVLDVYETNSSLQNDTLVAYHELASSQWASPWFVADPSEDAHSLAQEILNILHNSCS